MACCLNSSLHPAEYRQAVRNIRSGTAKLLFLSPERMQHPQTLSLLRERGVSLVAIDEAHCISQWGHDFRTDYLKLPELISQLGSPPVIALTATATPEVREEICNLFQIPSQNVHLYSVDRPNIALDLLNVQDEQEKLEKLSELIRELEGPGIVYCATRQAVENVTAFLQQQGLRNVHGYHGGMDGMERALVQGQFLQDQLQVIVATNAFGMGIDKPNIRYVIHYHVPSSLEAYVQEVGRIGRDGSPGYACLLHRPEDAMIHHRLFQLEFPSEEETGQFLNAIWAAGSEISHEQIHLNAGIGETAAHTLFFYLEKVGCITEVAATANGYKYQIRKPVSPRTASALVEHLERRKAVKKRLLWQMTEWIQGESCRREALTRYFGEEPPTDKPHSCCYRCGISRQRYVKGHTGKRENVAIQWDLKAAISALFSGRANEAERTLRRIQHD